MKKIEYESSSFRDPKGKVFYYQNRVFRYISESAISDFEMFNNSGLSKFLLKNKKIIPFKKTDLIRIDKKSLTIECEKIKFISYPYEWSFSQYKDAALLTLDIMKDALKHKMWLKDASAYNIQFYDGRPVFIDLLSFEAYPEGSPWVAYRQFCKHFLAPLLLMSKVGISLSGLLKHYIDGVPLELTSRLLPYKTRFSPFINLHIHLHAKMEKKYADRGTAVREGNIHFSIKKLENLVQSLYSLIGSLKLKNLDTEWGNYYAFTNYSEKAFKLKKEIISKFVTKVKPETVFDFGANTGEFSRINLLKKATVVSFDIDYLAVERNYLFNCRNNIRNILPLYFDITNPSPAIGWDNNERKSFKMRCNADLIFALALIHHLAISNNVPLKKIAQMFASLSKNIVIEFVPKEDSQVQKLLSSREDIFVDYDTAGFEKAFSLYFKIIDKQQITDSCRTLYLLKTIR